ncbi:PPOX class F420-dependent oxidoreductase [Actinoplanes sp. NPDC051851]|uniref:PPOX class F420-dependent oxidoreductase n=1 Tax=Actinoplanes sp. NPDC051851 TaxID=3154753 RepID=UPI0034415FFF
MPTLKEISSSRYASLTTFRKDGTPVASPLWVLPDGAGVAFWTITDSWKVKRARNNPRVIVTACDIRGRLTGAPVEGTARIGDDTDRARIARALGRKYWITGRIGLIRNALSRRPGRITVILVDPA